MKDVFIHPRAIVESDQIGAGTRIWANAHVMKGAIIGRDCNIGDGAFIEGGAHIGDNVTVKNLCLIWDGVRIANNAFIGPNVAFTNDAWPRSPRMELVHPRYADKAKWLVPTTVNEGAAIGAGAIIRCGITIGEFSTVGIGAVVTRDVPAYALVYGSPARVMGAMCRCGQKLTFRRRKANCPVCGSRYEQQRKCVRWLGA